MIPIFVSYLFQQLYNTVDTIIVGYFLQEGSLAAVGSCSAIFELVLSLGNGFGTYIIARHIAARKVFMLFVELIFSIGVAISTFVSQNFGAGRLDRVRKGVRGQISSFR
ncbi:MAG: hypothetical protein IJU95_05115 [Treponema sp.]|nr:hypothetical protein [Treponema sp.]